MPDRPAGRRRPARCARPPEEGTAGEEDPSPDSDTFRAIATSESGEECHANEIVAACSPDRHRRRARRSLRTERRDQPRRRLRPAPGASQPAPSQRGRRVVRAGRDLRWYCCLGTGEDPVQIPIEEEVAADFDAKHPGHHLKFEVVTYDAGPRHAVHPDRVAATARTSSARSASAASPPSTASGSTSPRSSPTTGYDIEPVRPGRRRLLQDRRRARSGCRSRSTRRCSGTRRTCSRRPASSRRRTSTATSTRCPTAPRSTGTTTRSSEIAKLLTVDENGNDATQPGFDPENDRPVRLRAAARRPARPRRLLRRRQPRRRRRQDRRDPGRLGGRLEVLLRRHVDRPLHHDRRRSPRARSSTAAATRSSRAASR